MYPNRHICQALEEMRACYETRNFAALLGLIEEVQSMANRMESGLEDNRDLKKLTEDRQRLSEQVDKLRAERDKLQPPAVEIEWEEEDE